MADEELTITGATGVSVRGAPRPHLGSAPMTRAPSAQAALGGRESPRLPVTADQLLF